MFPLRGLWNNAPPEGDRFIACEIDWGSTAPLGQGVQCALSGNSPLNFSQIVSIAVDNARCGADVQFVFTDSGFVLQVPSYNQGIYPVFTNALMFYVYANNAAQGDVTTFNVHNSVPPPVQISAKQEVNQASAIGINAAVAGTTPIVPPPTSGTLTGFNIMLESGVVATANLSLVDGTGRVLWSVEVTLQANSNTPVTVTGLNIRFFNGLNFVVSGPTGGGPTVVNVNVYYGVP